MEQHTKIGQGEGISAFLCFRFFKVSRKTSVFDGLMLALAGQGMSKPSPLWLMPGNQAWENPSMLIFSGMGMPMALLWYVQLHAILI